MHRVAFKMTLYKGFAGEYKNRHERLWPDLERALKEAGISDYSIFLDEETNTLFGVLKASDQHLLVQLPDNPVMQQWWQYMSDIMETNDDNSPVTVTLEEVFHMP
jgi:L-rhamnose mutarotase